MGMGGGMALEQLDLVLFTLKKTLPMLVVRHEL